MSAFCHICETETDPDYICTGCDELVCEDCMVKMTIHNQIDYCLCESCHSGNQTAVANHYMAEEKRNEELLKVKKTQAEKRYKWYHSPAQVEKRRLKRIELMKLRSERAAKRAQEIGKMFADMFKYM